MAPARWQGRLAGCGGYPLIATFMSALSTVSSRRSRVKPIRTQPIPHPASGSMKPPPSPPQFLERLQYTVRSRVLRHFRRHDLLEPPEAEDMLTWEHGGGFSLDASVRVEATDRDGLERLIRYCARPPFALERLTSSAAAPTRSSTSSRSPTWPAAPRYASRPSSGLPLLPPPASPTASSAALRFLDRLAKILPPPRLHRHRYRGVFAPNAPLRPLVTARAQEDNALAALLGHIYEAFPLICPTCRMPLTFIAFLTDPEPITQILAHIGEPTSPRSPIPPGDHPRPSSIWGPTVGNTTRPPRDSSSTTSTRPPGSIPPTPSPFRKTTSISAGRLDPSGPPAPPQARQDSPNSPPPHPKPHPPCLS